ncbi:MAG: hypothetical protein AB1489_21540 [Acidobacteriota bacterium]
MQKPRNVFIAVGGSGTKVAEALVRLLAMGFPTRRDENNTLTSAGEKLEIWRLDPDVSSGAGSTLLKAVQAYQQLQEILGSKINPDGTVSSRWAMEIDTNIRQLDPFQLDNHALTSTKKGGMAKTLRGILDTEEEKKPSSKPVLNPFYGAKDLDITIDRGFYQKPFIGAAVIGVFVETLRDENTAGGKAVRFNRFQNVPTNFFLCGSLHGGTGACGVPVTGKFLGEEKLRNISPEPWRIGACLLAPYAKPPQPPLTLLDKEEVTTAEIEAAVKRLDQEVSFNELTPEEKRELAKQILLGFYADPNEMEARTRQSLNYFNQQVASYFNEVYLIGKPVPDTLAYWSNGGQRQVNPLNSAEVAAAISALNFFSRSTSPTGCTHYIAGTTETLDSQKMRLRDLPHYELGERSTEKIDPERVVLATAILHHLVLHQLPWDKPAKGWGNFRLLKHYDGNTIRQQRDHISYRQALDIIANSIKATFYSQSDDNGAVLTLGWDKDGDEQELKPLLANKNEYVEQVTGKLASKTFFNYYEPKEPLTLGSSAIKISTREFSEIDPGPDYSLGGYLRLLWSLLYEKK